MASACRTKSLSDPIEKSDGIRVLITRYRPRAVRKGEEAWDRWDKRLAPSVELLDAFQGKRRKAGRVVQRGLPTTSWKEYEHRFRKEMTGEEAVAAINEYADILRQGKTVTFLCYCADENRCHRSLVRGMVENRLYSA